MRRSLPLLPGEAQGVVLDMLKPENLAIIGAAVAVWAASQFFGVGEFVDFILLVIGIRALGFSVLTGARELYYFVTTAVNATSSQDLDVAGQHFAQAVLILGISVVQAVLLRGAANKVVAPSRPQVKLRIQETDPPPADSRPPGTSDLPPDAPNTAQPVFETTEAVNISGSRPIDLGQSYEDAVQGLYSNASVAQREYTAFVNGKWVDGLADDVTVIDGKPTAVEAKYVDDWADSLRNPDSPNGSKPWAVEERQTVIDQAAKYSVGFDGGVIYHTNSVDFANYYTLAFNNAKITNFRFVITPATKF